MSKNTIIEQLANNEATLDLACNKLLLIANVINNKELLKWVEHEISGYQDSDNLPIYRKNDKSMHFIFSGLNGTYPVNNVPMPIAYFPEEIRNSVITVKILDGVKIIERQLAVKDNEWSAVRDCTEYAPDVYTATGIQCFNISQVLQKSNYEKVYNNIKVHLIKILLMIEKYFGSLDTAELGTRKYEKQKVLMAAKEISEYILSLYDNKSIPNPRISMSAKNQTSEKREQLANQKAELNNQNLNQQPVYQPVPQMPQQQMYQMPQQPMPPQMPPQQVYQMPQQPMPPQQVYQMPQQPVPPQQQVQEVVQWQDVQPQAPVFQPQEPVVPIEDRVLTDKQEQLKPEPLPQSEPEIAAQEQQPTQEVQSETVQPAPESNDKDDFILKAFGVQEKPEKVVAAPVLEKQESKPDKKEEAAKAADIRKDRIPKSLLDYLEEKKTELNKKPE